MKAIRYKEPRNFSYEEVATPKPGPDEVLIRVKACGLCGTDLHIHEGEFFVKFPVIPGHEFTGEVAEVGANVTHLRSGDRVVVDNMTFCGHCYHCVGNRPLYCENLRALGVTEPGGFAEYVIANVALTFPTTLSWRQAVMVEPTACAVHGLDVLNPKPGCDVLLFGAGPTGLVMAQLLKHHGAARLVVAAPAGRKLDLAAELAADEVVELDRKS
jgi:D-arabinitol dehydrogenase (NADP+)